MNSKVEIVDLDAEDDDHPLSLKVKRGKDETNKESSTAATPAKTRTNGYHHGRVTRSSGKQKQTESSNDDEMRSPVKASKRRRISEKEKKPTVIDDSDDRIVKVDENDRKNGNDIDDNHHMEDKDEKENSKEKKEIVTISGDDDDDNDDESSNSKNKENIEGDSNSNNEKKLIEERKDEDKKKEDDDGDGDEIIEIKSDDKEKEDTKKEPKLVEAEETEVDDTECGFPGYMRGAVIRGKCIPINKRTWKEINIEGNDAILDCASQVVPLMIKKPDIFPEKLSTDDGCENGGAGKAKKMKLDEDDDDDKDDKRKKEAQKNASQKTSITGANGEEVVDKTQDDEDEGGVEVDEGNDEKDDDGGGDDEVNDLNSNINRSLLAIADYYKSSIGKFLMGIGLSQAKEWYHKDIIRQLQKEARRKCNDDDVLVELRRQQSYLNQAKTANNVFNFDQRKCHLCDFKTESEIVLEGHFNTPHLSNRKEFKCNFCLFVTRDARTIMTHFHDEHHRTCNIEPPQQLYECPTCSYESSQKAKAMTHFAKCVKTFEPDKVCYQAEIEAEHPSLTPKPITQDDINVYEDTLSNFRNLAMSGNLRTTFNFVPGLPRGLQYQMFIQQQQLAQQARLQRFSRPLNGYTNQLQTLTGNELYTQAMQQQQLMFAQQQQIQQQQKMLEAASLQTLKNRICPNAGASVTIPKSLVNLNKINVFGKGLPANEGLAQKSGTFVICEICDGYIKDLEQLRTHMQWIHKVKIHPKMLASRPPLNCQKCQWRFFTDQGLERHLLGAHGLVTSNMQDLVDQNLDGGRCTICGRVFANKLVSHMNQVHKITLRPAHLSYKCTVCSATFNLYRLFESHVYMVHSGSVKRSNGNIEKSC